MNKRFLFIYLILIPCLNACVHSGRYLGQPFLELTKSSLPSTVPNIVGRLRLFKNLLGPSSNENKVIRPYYFNLLFVKWARHIDIRIQKVDTSEIYYFCDKFTDGWFHLTLDPGEYILYDAVLYQEGSHYAQNSKDLQIVIPIECKFQVPTDNSLTYIGSIEVKRDNSKPWAIISSVWGTTGNQQAFTSRNILVKDESDTAYSFFHKKYSNSDKTIYFDPIKCK